MALKESQLMERLRSIDTEEIIKLKLPDFYHRLGPKGLGLFADEKSFKLFVLDYLLKSILLDNAECPVKYYSEGEELVEVQEEKEEDLTDEYIANTMKSR